MIVDVELTEHNDIVLILEDADGVQTRHTWRPRVKDVKAVQTTMAQISDKLAEYRRSLSDRVVSGIDSLLEDDIDEDGKDILSVIQRATATLESQASAISSSEDNSREARNLTNYISDLTVECMGKVWSKYLGKGSPASQLPAWAASPYFLGSLEDALLADPFLRSVAAKS